MIDIYLVEKKTPTKNKKRPLLSNVLKIQDLWMGLTDSCNFFAKLLILFLKNNMMGN